MGEAKNKNKRKKKQKDDLETVNLELLLAADLVLDKELSNVVTLVTLQLQNLVTLLILQNSSVSRVGLRKHNTKGWHGKRGV